MRRIIVSLLLGTVLSALAYGGEPGAVETLALFPQSLYKGGSNNVVITSVDTASMAPVDAPYDLTLKQGNQTYSLASGSTGPNGHTLVNIQVPSGVSKGSARLYLTPTRYENVSVYEGPFLFIETDKAIYTQGQTVLGRVLLLDASLRPAAEDTYISINDAKGNKIYELDGTTSAFGVLPFDVPLAEELNFGTWEIRAVSNGRAKTAQVRVERYVLPKFGIDIEPGKNTYLWTEPITGTIHAGYFHGQPVQGHVHLRALMLHWTGFQEYAVFDAELTGGQAAFSLPHAPWTYYGPNNLVIEATVTDATGDIEKATEFITILSYQPTTAEFQASPNPYPPGSGISVSLYLKEPQLTWPITNAQLTARYYDIEVTQLSEDARTITLTNEPATHDFSAPLDAAKTTFSLSYYVPGFGNRSATWTVYAAHAPSNVFLDLAPLPTVPLNLGDALTLEFSGGDLERYYYVICAQGKPVWTGVATAGPVVAPVFAGMAPNARAVVYGFTPQKELVAVTKDLEVRPGNTTGFEVSFDRDQAEPGGPVQLRISSDADAAVGLSLVDASVLSFGKNEVALPAVYGLAGSPRIRFASEYTVGALQMLEQGGIGVINTYGLSIPYGERIEHHWSYEGEWYEGWWGGEGEGEGEWDGGEGEGEGEEPPGEVVARMRQYFPETWLWQPELAVEAGTNTLLDLTAPDSITTWRLHAVASSAAGISTGEDSLLVFQEFFGEPDLPYAVTRGERFPVRVQVFNYVGSPQAVTVIMTDGDWFEALDPLEQTISVPANSAGLASFLIRPRVLGTHPVEVHLQSGANVDACTRELRVEPEGVPREAVFNQILRAGESWYFDTNFPGIAVEGSQKAILNIMPGMLAQTMAGLENLLEMPWGCGEQNMINLAPDIQILRYLDATGQAAPDIREKALHYIATGYQRELGFQRTEGSFAANGNNSSSGSTWLTAYVLGTFSDARDIYPVDETALDRAAAWLITKQSGNGSWPAYGFCHIVTLDDYSVNYASTAYTLLALADYGRATPVAVNNGLTYLANEFGFLSDSGLAVALGALAFARYGHAMASTAIDRLIEMASTDDHGTTWDGGSVESTAYAALALQAMDRLTLVNRATDWLVANRNPCGGFRNTQDTVVAIKALANSARFQTRSVDLLVQAKETGQGDPGAVRAEFHLNNDNFDLLQTAILPIGLEMELAAQGTGQTMVQLVKRYNVLVEDDGIANQMSLDVDWGRHYADIGEALDVEVTLDYGRNGLPSGMGMIEIGIPTGFEPVQESVEALRAQSIDFMNHEVLKRKLVLYFDKFPEQAPLQFGVRMKAIMPAVSLIPGSVAYLYYEPEVRAEAGAGVMTVELFTPGGDEDGDGLPNEWENRYGLDFESRDGDDGPDADPDNDGLTNLDEFRLGTDPRHADDIYSRADTDRDNAISLSELLRMVQFFNAGALHCESGTEDGYAPGPGDQSCTPHNGDYLPSGPDWRIVLTELLRMIQFYNMGGYHRCGDTGTEDGFCPGPRP